MRKQLTKSLFLLPGLLLVSASVWAHHGQGLSFDTAHMWSTWGTVEEFNYINPHPAIKFTRTDKNGKVEHWGAEVANNPSRLAREGWTKSRCNSNLSPNTRVKLYLATSLAGGYNGVVQRIENEKGELICSVASDLQRAKEVLDLDGVPGGYQPKLDRAKASGEYNKEQ